MNKVLASGSKSINKDRYLRLLWVAAGAFTIHLPLSSWLIIVRGTAYPVAPWESWEVTHKNFRRIAYFTRFMLSTDRLTVATLSIGYWSLPLCGLIIFTFFGFGEEASKQRETILGAILKPFGIKYPKATPPTGVKKSWVDVLLGRPGKPINPNHSFVAPSSPHFGASSNLPLPSRLDRPRRVLPARGHTVNDGIDDFDFDISDVESLGPANTRQQNRLSDFRGSRPRSIGNNDHEPQFPEKAMTGPSAVDMTSKRRSTLVTLDIPISTIEAYTGGGDIEGQEPDEEALAAERRRAILEANPELTEEVTF
ncbi:6523_t:CDS:1 [Acaulospora colombiana]|uniref:6523_t:CDS:1 n=1 Tax=Acaulospora colombiana TaxID=27376 RepID=A0ACA9N430_9GLOM|nr:6523_t:CDS:1 [Acaulospora colombiana]